MPELSGRYATLCWLSCTVSEPAAAGLKTTPLGPLRGHISGVPALEQSPR